MVRPNAAAAGEADWRGSRMRILHVVPSYWPAVRYGGTIAAVRGLCAALVAIGHDVEVLTTNLDGPGVSDVPLDRPMLVDGVVVHYFAVGTGRRFYRSPAMGRALQGKMIQADLVHVHAVFLWPGWMASRLACRAGVPYIVSPHGMLAPELVAGHGALRKRAWIRLIERRTLANAAAIHVTAATEGADIRALGLDLAPIVEVPNGVERPNPTDLLAAAEDDAAWSDVPRGRRLLFLGRISWKKGLDRLIAALARLPDAVLVVAGNDEEGLLPKLRDQADGIGVGSRLRFVGSVAGARKWTLLRGADLLVLPSLNENFGIVVLEALAVGTPVVVTQKVGAARIVAEHGVGAIAEGEPEPLAVVIGGLLADPLRRRTMGAQGVRIALGSYSWRAVAPCMVVAYQGAARARLGAG